MFRSSVRPTKYCDFFNKIIKMGTVENIWKEGMAREINNKIASQETINRKQYNIISTTSSIFDAKTI